MYSNALSIIYSLKSIIDIASGNRPLLIRLQEKRLLDMTKY